MAQAATNITDWEPLIPERQWKRYKCVLDQMIGHSIPFALGGGLAVGLYTGRLRDTKDLDLYILPKSKQKVISIMSVCGMVDYFPTLPYDREWIYRGTYEENGDRVLVDAIWSMANRRAAVDLDWLSRGAAISMFGDRFRVLPVEELIWSKLYVFQRDRCDWPDILNLLHAAGPSLDWDHLIDRVAEDLPLLKGVLSVFAWVDSERASAIPSEIWHTLGLPMPQTQNDPEGRPSRPNLLDTRPWFGDAWEETSC